MMNLQSTAPLVAGGPEWFTPMFALMAAGVVVALLILWWLAALAGRKAREARELKERDDYFYAAPEPETARPITPPPPVPPAPIPAAEDLTPPPPPEPVIEAAPEPVVEAAPEPERAPEPEPAAEAEPEPVAEPVVLEGAPAREPEPEPLPEAPSAEAEPVDASPAGEAPALTDPPVAAEGEPEIVSEPEPVAEPAPVAEAGLAEPAEADQLIIPDDDFTFGLARPGPDLTPEPLADEPIAAAAPFEASPATLAADLAEPAPEPVAEPAPEPVTEHIAAETAPELAAVDVVPEPVAEPEPVAAAPAADELTRMKGVGPRLADRLNSVGVTSFAQIAALTPEEAARLDSQLGDFQGRLERDRWIDQARFLSAGDIAGFEETFGKL